MGMKHSNFQIFLATSLAKSENQNNSIFSHSPVSTDTQSVSKSSEFYILQIIQSIPSSPCPQP